MPVDRPELSTATTEPAGNGHAATASAASGESDTDVTIDSTETLVSPGFGEKPPIVVPPAAPPPAGPPAAPIPSVPTMPPGPPAPPVGEPDGYGYEQSLRPRPRRGSDGGGEGRWVTHRLRGVSLWSVFKVATLFYVCLFFSLLVATVLLWNVGRASGTVDRFESFVSGMGAYGECVPEKSLQPGTEFEKDKDCKPGNVRVGNFHLDGGVVFRSALFGGLVFVMAATLGTLLLTILFNLLNDITGGVRYTMIREPSGSPPPPGAVRRRAARMGRAQG